MSSLLCLLLGLLGVGPGAPYHVRGLATTLATGAPLDGVRITILSAATRDTLLADLYTDANGAYTAMFDFDVGTAVEEYPVRSSVYWAEDPYPNPAVAGARVTIRFGVPGGRPVPPALDVYDVLGRKVDPTHALASGVYLYRVRFEDGNVTEPKTLVVQHGGLLYIALEQVTGGTPAAEEHAGKQRDALEVVFVLEKDGYDVIEATHNLESGVENTYDFALLLSGSGLTPEQRMAALDDVEAVIASRPGTDFDADTQALVAFLQSRAEFTAVGTSDDGTIWARFADGTLVFIVHSAPADEGPGKAMDYLLSAPDRLHPRRDLPAPARTSLTFSAGTGTVPTSPRFRLLNGVGSFFGGSDPRGAVQGMLTQKGYTGTSGAATLAALRGVSGDGIFYFRTHGGAAFRQLGLDEDLYAMWTASPALDPADEKNDPQLVDDLKNKRIGYMLFRNTRWTQGLPFIPEDRHYGITHRFIEHYMSFGQNSLVYLDACDGGHWPFVRDAFKKKGASVFVGWNERALFSAMGRTAQFVFDRLLGANTFNPESPPQRPFNYIVLPDDPKFGNGKTYGYSVGTDRAGGPILAELGFYPVQGDFGFLAPSIKRMEVDEVKQELTIHGLFGQDPGTDKKVTVGGAQTGVKQWKEEEIVVDLPPSLAGNVIVAVRDHESNPAPLTEWKGVFHYTADVSAVAFLPANTLQQEVACSNVHIRADVHDYREKPGAPPISPPDPIPFVAARDSRCDWQFSGSGTNTDGVTGTLSGGGLLPWQDPNQGLADPTILIMGEIDVSARTLRLVSAMHPAGFFPFAIGEITASDPNGTVTGPFPLAPPIFSGNPTITLDPHFGMQAGFIAETIISTPPVSIELEWDATAAGYAPDANTQARYVEGPMEVRPEAGPGLSPRGHD